MIEYEKVLAQAKPVAAPVIDTDRLLAEFSKRLREVDTNRRVDILVSLPAALAALTPLLFVGCTAIGVQVFLVLPIVIKILRKL